jgi:hypothetical protein
MKTKEIMLWIATGLAIAWYIYKGDYITLPLAMAAIALARYSQREK